MTGVMRCHAGYAKIAAFDSGFCIVAIDILVDITGTGFMTCICMTGKCTDVFIAIIEAEKNIASMMLRRVDTGINELHDGSAPGHQLARFFLLWRFVPDCGKTT